jgi:hypothetical protein
MLIMGYERVRNMGFKDRCNRMNPKASENPVNGVGALDHKRNYIIENKNVNVLFSMKLP